MAKRRWLAGLWLFPVACGGGDGVAPPLPPCTSGGFAVNLAAPGDYTAIDPGPVSGCTVFPAAPPGSQVEYLLVPQSASSKPNDSQNFNLLGAALALAGMGPQFSAREAARAELAPAEQFHLFLRQSERARSYTVPPRPQRAAGAQLTAQAPPPPRRPLTPADSGMVYSFKVCGNLDCTTLPTVEATLMKIGQRSAIYVDTNAPSPRLSQADLDGLRAIFDTLLYRVDTLAFGRESDIDGNGVVIVLMTNRVNQLVPAPTTCPDGYVAGFFFGADIDPFFRTQYNNGEIFYTIVADQGGTLSCPHPVSQVTRQVPLTLVHEFQHMISYNQHVLVRSGQAGEILWLNEALSHYAEERAGRSFLPGDSLSFCRFVAGDLYNAGQYLAAPESYFLVDTAGIGGLAERGAYWLFLRYLIDQYADPSSSSPPPLLAADAYTRSLVNTSATGVTNVVQRAGNTPFATLVSRWALANWVSDLSGFPAPAELRYKTWAFRSAYPLFSQGSSWQCTNQLPPAFPLFPGVSPGSAVDLNDVLRAGSGPYHLSQQAAGAPGFTLLFSDDAGRALRASLVPRLNVIRIQ